MNICSKLVLVTLLGLLSFNAHANEECLFPLGYDYHTEHQYGKVDCLSEGLAAFHDDDDKAGFMDYAGNIIIPPTYDIEFSQVAILPKFQEGLAAVHLYPEPLSDDPEPLGGKWGFINPNGDVVIPLQYKHAGNFSEGLAAVINSKDKVGFINQNGEVVIPFKYAYMIGAYHSIWTPTFSEGLAAVKMSPNGKFGYINKNGELVIPYQYDSAEEFSEGLAVVSKNNREFFIDKTGKTAIRLKADESVAGYRGKIGFVDGLADISPHNGTGSYQINKQGQRVN